jgi:uncharacterized NAD(P)/FAD-binding protein YdhS
MTQTSVVIVGGGLSGALFGLKLHRARPGWRITVVEPRKKLGRGIAYGACGPRHLLNVPVSRMEVGLKPGFAQWLEPRRADIAEALVESELDLAAAFVPRRLFGDYIEERINEALSLKSRSGFTAVRGEAVRLVDDGHGVLLTDGREIRADMVVLAMGNLPPRPPGGPDRWLYDTGFFIPDPWAAEAFSDVDPGEPLLLIGAGLTTVDVALRLAQDGRGGACSRASTRAAAPGRNSCTAGFPLRHWRCSGWCGPKSRAQRPKTFPGSVCSTPPARRWPPSGMAGTIASAASSCGTCGRAGTFIAIAPRRASAPRWPSWSPRASWKSPRAASPAMPRRKTMWM